MMLKNLWILLKVIWLMMSNVLKTLRRWSKDHNYDHYITIYVNI